MQCHQIRLLPNYPVHHLTNSLKITGEKFIYTYQCLIVNLYHVCVQCKQNIQRNSIDVNNVVLRNKLFECVYHCPFLFVVMYNSYYDIVVKHNKQS